MPRRGPALLPAVVLAWLLAVAAVGTGGNFPLSDDWAYAHVVKSLLAGRGFDFLPWTGASLFVQALYGAAACMLTGFSHETLRATTLVLAAGGIAATHALLRELGAGAAVSAAGAAAVAFSPLWFHLSFTFMTDVPFAALAVTSAWLYARGLSRNSRRALLLAGATAAAAFLIRQHALSIAVAAAAVALWSPEPAAGDRAAGLHGDGTDSRTAELRRSRLSSRALDAAAALALPALAAAAYTVWAATSAGAPLAVHNKLGDAAAISLIPAANAAFRAIATLGLLLLPWALALRLRPGRERRAFAACLAVLGAAAALLFVRERASMFYLSNVMGDFSVGALTTRDMLFLARDRDVTGGPWLHFVLTALSLASAAAVLARLLSGAADRMRQDGAGNRRRTAAFCVLALALSGLGTLAQAHYYFDRYLLVLVPLSIAALVALSPPLRPGPAFAGALLALSLYAVTGTHDYMEWNRARWDLLSSLEQRGVTARSIDGGVEYNAERLAAELRTAPTDAEARRGQPSSRPSWWWVVDDEWVISFQPLDGYVEADSRSFARWLPPGPGRVLALRREAKAGGRAPAAQHHGDRGDHGDHGGRTPAAEHRGEHGESNAAAGGR